MKNIFIISLFVFSFILSSCSLLNFNKTHRVVSSKKIPEVKIEIPNEWRIFSQQEHIQRLNTYLEPKSAKKSILMAKMAKLYISIDDKNNPKETLPELIILKTPQIREFTEAGILRLMVNSALKEDKTVKLLGDLQIIETGHIDSIYAQEIEYTQKLKSGHIRETSILSSKYLNNSNYLISGAYRDQKGRELILKAIQSIRIASAQDALPKVEEIANNHKAASIDARFYTNKDIPLKVEFPNLMHLASKKNDPNSLLFRLFKYQLGSPISVNPQIECHAYKSQRFGVDNMSVDEFISVIDKTQGLSGNNKIKYTSIKTVKTVGGIAFKKRSTDIKYKKLIIAADQYFTKINKTLLFCGVSREKGSQEDAIFFEKIIRSFSDKL